MKTHEKVRTQPMGGGWQRAMSADQLRKAGRAVKRIGGKQIALFMTPQGIRACNNRCPHEGYPLREGMLDECGILTCNWHNWKFDLADGANLYGGDQLRMYPARIVEGEIWVDVTDPAPEARQTAALARLREAFDSHEYDRIARELARFVKAGGDGASAVTAAILWSYDKLEFGTTHAYAGAACWLTLYGESHDPETRLAALTEAVAGISYDVLREPVHAYPEKFFPWDETAFDKSLEERDEVAAIARLRGAWAQGLHFADLERALSDHALRHYADFGHSLIYLSHTGRLIARLGAKVEAPLLLAFVRSLVHASHEELIPKFRGYSQMLRAWPSSLRQDSAPTLDSEAFRNLSVDATMATVVEAAAYHEPQALHAALLAAGSRNLLEYDTRWEANTKGSVERNVGWLDFTHALTFASAMRSQCTKYPELWPSGLLQMACFIGRNTGFTAPEPNKGRWHVRDRDAFHDWCLARVCDHAEDAYIFGVHLLKTFLAVREEVAAGVVEETADTALAALNRFLNAPLKRKHVRRTAHQARKFVALED